MLKVTLIIILTLSLLQAKEQVLTITSGFDVPETNLIEEVLKEGFKRAGIGLQYQTLPNQRSLINANRGLADGEAARIWEINDFYPNLVRVPVSIHAIDLVLLSRKKIIINEPLDLKNYHVGVIRGMKIAEELAQNSLPLSITVATKHLALIQMLTHHRLDIIITNKIGLLTGLKYAQQESFYILKKPLLSRPLYMQLHKKHQALIPRFEKAFQSMVDDGTLKKIQENFLHDLEYKINNTLEVILYE